MILAHFLPAAQDSAEIGPEAAPISLTFHPQLLTIDQN